MNRIILSIIIALISTNTLFAQELLPILDRSTNKYGYKEKGKQDWSLPPTYDDAKVFKDKIAEVAKGEYSYFINLQGKKISPDFIYISRMTSDGFMPIIGEDSNKNFRLYDYDFKPITEDNYEYLSFTYSCLNYVVSFKKNGLYGIMDLAGNTIIPAEYKSLKMNNYYYAIGYKKCNKDNISNNSLDNIFLEAENSIGKYGVLSISNEIIAPFRYADAYKLYKGMKSYYKVVKDFMLSDKIEKIEKQLSGVYQQIRRQNEQLASVYPSTLPKVSQTTIKKTKAGYVFIKDKKQVGKTYQMIDEYSNFCIVKRNKKLGICNRLGGEVVECKYDDINIWNAKDEILMAERLGKYYLFTADGKEISTKAWDKLFFPINDVAVGIKNGLCWLLNNKGVVISTCGYDDIDNYSNDSKITASLLGYSTELNTNGEEVSPIAKQIFNEAYNLSLNDNAQAKYDKYMLCISLDADNKLGYRSLCLNNIGAMFEDLGDTDKALTYYGKARDLGNTTAKKNIRRIKTDRVLNTLQQVGETLSQIGQTIDTSGSYGTYQTGNSYDTSSMSSSSTSSTNGNKHSYDYWKQMYDRWERNAKGCYESLTLNGYKKKTNGKDTGGGALGTWNSGAYTGLKSNLRKAQKEMRDTRAQARKEGYNIPQSNYETINVSY